MQPDALGGIYLGRIEIMEKENGNCYIIIGNILGLYTGVMML